MILTNTQNVCFPQNNTGISVKKYKTANNCADQIDVITNIAIITNVVIKGVHCMSKLYSVI